MRTPAPMNCRAKARPPYCATAFLIKEAKHSSDARASSAATRRWAAPDCEGLSRCCLVVARERGYGFGGHFDRNEKVGREQVVLSGLVDHAEKGVGLRIRV